MRSTTPHPPQTPPAGRHGSADRAGTDCGCPASEPADADILGRYGFSRRAFLKRSAVVATATALTGRELATQLAFAATPSYAGDVMIVLSLRGGFDGLSVVVPRGDPTFNTLRPSIAIPDSQLQVLGTVGNGNDNRFGLHPAMAPLMPMWAAGTFGVGVAVGQVNPTRSHFEATQELEKAGVIRKYAALLEPRKVGLGMMSFVTVKLEKKGKMPAEEFAKAVRGWPEVVGCYSMTGETDYFLQVYVEDLDHYTRFLMGRLLKQAGVVDVKSNIVLEAIKDTTALPLEQVAPGRRKRT